MSWMSWVLIPLTNASIQNYRSKPEQPKLEHVLAKTKIIANHHGRESRQDGYPPYFPTTPTSRREEQKELTTDYPPVLVKMMLSQDTVSTRAVEEEVYERRSSERERERKRLKG